MLPDTVAASAYSLLKSRYAADRGRRSAGLFRPGNPTATTFLVAASTLQAILRVAFRADRPYDFSSGERGKSVERVDIDAFEAEFEREIAKDDDSAAREILASGRAIHIARDDTPAGHVIRVYPDGREELVAVDRERLANKLGR